jgi:hypothetical protein
MADAFSAEDFAAIRTRVAHRAADDRPLEGTGGVEFDAVGPEIAEPFANPRWDEECRDLGVVLRMAAIVVQKTKPELIAMVEALLDGRDQAAADAFVELLTCSREFQKRLELWRRLLEAAEIRQLIAASALSPDDGGGARGPARSRLPRARYSPANMRKEL